MALSKIQNNSYEDTAVHGRRNLIINGAMTVSQRGTSFTPNTGVNYSLDRYATLEVTDGDITISQDTSVVPTGFQYSLKALVGTADASLAASQRMILLTRIEGYDVAHFELGTANAKQFTLSFYIRSSLTGTFGGAFQNSDSSRAYPFTYTINSADTWERKTITITGDTSGTWNTTNGTGLQVCWGLGVGSTHSGTAGAWASGDFNSATGGTNLMGTSSATWYLTGVQVEVGATATPFEHEDYGTTLAKCQRYYQRIQGVSGNQIEAATGVVGTSTSVFRAMGDLKVTMRAAPTLSATGLTAYDGSSNPTVNLSTSYSTPNQLSFDVNGGVSLTVGRAGIILIGANAANYFDASAEL